MSPRSRARKPRPRRTPVRSAPPPASVADHVAAAVSAQQPRTAAAPQPTGRELAGQARLMLTTVNCEPVRELEPRGLGMTYHFDSSRWPDPARVTVRFDGQLSNASAGAAAATFTLTEVVDVPARAGRVTVTARAANVAAGSWRVTAEASVQSVN